MVSNFILLIKVFRIKWKTFNQRKKRWKCNEWTKENQINHEKKNMKIQFYVSSYNKNRNANKWWSKWNILFVCFFFWNIRLFGIRKNTKKVMIIMWRLQTTALDLQTKWTLQKQFENLKYVQKILTWKKNALGKHVLTILKVLSFCAFFFSVCVLRAFLKFFSL